MASETVSGVQMVSIEDLHPAEHNPRYITPTAMDRLKKAMESDPEMMKARPLIALPDGTIIAGNMRWRAAQALGWREIQVIYADLDEKRAKLWMLRDNNEYGDWADSALGDLLVELKADGADMELTGFTTGELNKLFKKLEVPPEETAPQLEDVEYRILITCASEEHQAELAATLEADGLDIKMLMA